VATSSNRRQRVIQFTTPKVSDLVVVEVIDASKTISSADSADDSTYGSSHPDSSRFPSFKLAHIKNADDQQGQFQYWYYVKDRAEQDKYNWEFQAASASMRYDSVVRTYILPRYGSDPDGAPATGQVAGTDYFEEAAPVLNTAMPTTIHDPFGQGVGPTAVGSTSDYTDSNYILFEKKQVRSGDELLDSLYVIEQRVYVKKVPIRRIDIDAEFSVPLRTKETLYYSGQTLQKTVRFKEPTDEVSNLSPSVTVDQATKKGKDQADMWGTFRESYPTDATTTTTADTYFGIYREVRQLSNNWFAVAEREIIKTSRDDAQTTNETTQLNEGLVETYFITRDFSWPAVLNATTPVYANTWSRRNGGAETIVYPNFLRDAYSGPTKMKVEKFWNTSAFGGPQYPTFSATNLQLLHPMLPETIKFQTPIVAVGIKPTLHGDVVMSVTAGSNHPVYEFENATVTYSATHNHTDWPTSLVISDSQKPFRGGYLRERITAYKPHQSS